MFQNNPLLKTVTKVVFPLILLFALYTLAHGKASPGGGFQAGAIATSGFILYSLVFGLEKCQKIISSRTLEKLAAIGILIFLIVGGGSLSFGLNYLDYSYFSADKILANKIGISLVEFGVGLTVFSTTLLFFYIISEKK